MRKIDSEIDSDIISKDNLERLRKIDPMDRDASLTNGDFERFLKKDPSKSRAEKEAKLRNEAPIPTVSKLIVTPPPPTIGGDKTISFSVTDQVPLRDVLIELGRVAKIDVDLDSSISGGIVLNAKNRPFKEVIDRIATLGKLRYSYKNGVLYFERDTPYTKSYFVDYLSDGKIWDDVKTTMTSIIDNNKKTDTTSSSKSSDTSADSKTSSSTKSSTTTTKTTTNNDIASNFSINKSAGIISVFATKTQHDSIASYLNDMYKVSSSQVLIEAKVVEVTLNKEFQSGIDWTWIDAGKSVVSAPGGASSAVITAILPKVKFLGLGGNINATIRALEQFGTARSVSSPRISAINNQKAFLDFSQKLIYFTVNSAQSNAVTNTTTTTTTLTTTKFEESVGVQLSITPAINLKTNEITLQIKPKLSANSGEVAIDPSVNPATGKSLGNQIPIIKTRELDTVAKVQSGSVLVIGGLMSEVASNNDSGVPFLSRIPILGYLFKSSSKKNSIVETVIFIKATIVNNGSGPKQYDREFYDKFTTDRKPFLN